MSLKAPFARKLVAWAVVARLIARNARNSLRGSLGCAPIDPSLGEQWRSIHRSSPRRRPAPASAPLITFAPLWAGTSMVNKALESVMANALAARGAKVHVLTCGKSLLACVPDPLGCRAGVGAEADYRLPANLGPVCPSCQFTLDDIYRGSPIDRVSLRDHARGEDRAKALAIAAGLGASELAGHVFQGVPVGEHALSSALRATGRGTLDLADPAHERVLRRQLAGCVAMVLSATRYLEEHRPSRLVMMHGIYADHGTLSDCARRMGIPVTIFAKPYRRGTIMLCHGDTYHRALIDEPVSLWEDRPPHPATRRRLMDYIESKRTGSQDSETYHPNPISGRETVRRLLDLDAARPVVSVFTNVMWDAALFHKGSAFPNMLEWLHATIGFYAARPGIQLVIRVHPAEVKAVKKSLQPVAEEIRRRYPALPANVRVVGPESDLSSYDLVDLSSACVVYGTKMALEIVLRGVPTVVAGESFIRGKGFTLDAGSPADYARILEDLHLRPRLDEPTLERARRYAEHFFFRRQIDFPLVVEQGGAASGLRIISTDDLLPGACPALDAVCEGLLGGKDILAPSSS